MQELELELPPELQGLTTIIITTVTYPTAKPLEEKEHYKKELEGLYTPNLVLGEQDLRGVILQLSLLLELGPLIQLN